ncbi:unnamed protein product [Phytophthora lilii]|uniref:Unnamed protein product n=1 Tax=Phytophthora lilii TaxID=2077276 RepID=A0A9W6WI77_9STRA|nr:unnamed protein product [Phytophthora lilii]
MTRANEERRALMTSRSQWKDWYMGFTHFVQLQLEPNEDTFWYLLGRRAAGIFPRNQNGADLLIPIFWQKPAATDTDECEMKADDTVEVTENKVSLTMVQVKSRSTVDF